MEERTMSIEEFGIKIINIDEKKGTLRFLMPDGSTRRWSHYDWKSRKNGEDFINKFLLNRILPGHDNISVEHHKNWERMWACCKLDAFPLGIEYFKTCSRIPRVDFSIKCELVVDFQQSDVFVEIGGIINIPGTRQFFELDNSQYQEFLQNNWCYYNGGITICNSKLMIQPRLVRLGT